MEVDDTSISQGNSSCQTPGDQPSSDEVDVKEPRSVSTTKLGGPLPNCLGDPIRTKLVNWKFDPEH